MTEQLLLSRPLDEDLSGFSQALRRQGIVHRIIEANGEQQIWLHSDEDMQRLQHILTELDDGGLDSLLAQNLARDLDEGSVDSAAQQSGFWLGPLKALLDSIYQSPLSLLLIGLSLLGGLLVGLDPEFRWAGKLNYFPLEPVGDGRVAIYPMGQEYWRLLSPAFLHFGVLHTVFNVLWLWYLARLIEARLGAAVLFCLVLVVAVAANVAQAWHTGPGIFGGMSGVIYGLLGFALFWDRLVPRWPLAVPKNITVFMLLWLLLCLFGIVRLFSDGDAANAAHIAGLLSGLVLALPIALWRGRSLAV